MVDILVHAVAFAGRDELSRPYHLTSRAGFLNALDISAYSLTALTRGVAPLMKNGGSVLTLTYYGSEKVMPNYNVMGVAKAALEASVRYLAADLGPQANSGQRDFRRSHPDPERRRRGRLQADASGIRPADAAAP